MFISLHKEKYVFEGVALRRKVVSSVNRNKCNLCYLKPFECYSQNPDNTFEYDCYSRPSTKTSYIFVPK